MNTNTLKRDQNLKPLKRLSVVVSALLIIAITMFIIPNKTLIPTSGGATLYVGGTGFGNYSIIQDAIDNASAGYTVFVYNGTYYENIVINKSINLIGEDTNTTVINGSGSGDVIYIDNVDYVNITGFTIEYGEIGIHLIQSSNVNISRNRVQWSLGVYPGGCGIGIESSLYNNIYANEINDNEVCGISSWYSSNNNFINNMIHDNPTWGFHSSGSPYYNNNIIGNTVYNSRDAIILETQGGEPPWFWNCWVANNTIYNYGKIGIIMATGYNNYIIGNTIYNITTNPINPWGSIGLYSCNNTSVIGNIVYNGQNGIFLYELAFGYPPKDNIFKDNIIYNNEVGLWLSHSMNNDFINNTIFNSKNYTVYMPNDWGIGSNGNNFINCSLSNAAINVYMNNSHSNFINCTVTNAGTNIHMEQRSLINLINCSLSNAGIYDFNLTEESNAFLLNTTFDKDKVFYGDFGSTLTVRWFMHVNVKYWNGTPVSNAEIWVNETSGTNVLCGLADYGGWIKWIVAKEYVEQDFNGDHIGERFYFTPHNVTATDGDLWGYADPNMDISKVVVIILGAPPNILPPTNLTTKVVNNGDNVELEWEPSVSPILDHYLIYRADSATEFDFTMPYNSSTTWPDPKNTTWVDPDTTVTAVDDDFYYIVRAANFDESEISTTSNTAGVWTRTFQSGISTFSLPLEPFVKRDVEFYCQDMNASYIKWMNQTTHTWMLHNRGGSENNTLVEMGEGYEIGFLGKSGSQTRYTFTGMPGAMIIYDDDILFSGFDPATEARNLTVSIEPGGNVTLAWEEPSSMGVGDWYEVYYSNERDGFFKTLGVSYSFVCPPVYFGNNSATHEGAKANDPGARLYYMVVPFNAMGIRGAGTYSIGIWTEEYLSQYDTIGIPLKLSSNHTADWYCDNIPDTVGINYYMTGQERWSWHSTRMPGGAYDVTLEMTEGYQISTSHATKFTFIGV